MPTLYCLEELDNLENIERRRVRPETATRKTQIIATGQRQVNRKSSTNFSFCQEEMNYSKLKCFGLPVGDRLGLERIRGPGFDQLGFTDKLTGLAAIQNDLHILNNLAGDLRGIVFDLDG